MNKPDNEVDAWTLTMRDRLPGLTDTIANLANVRGRHDEMQLTVDVPNHFPVEACAQQMQIVLESIAYGIGAAQPPREVVVFTNFTAGPMEVVGGIIAGTVDILLQARTPQEVAPAQHDPTHSNIGSYADMELGGGR